jgi:hypothetical protein
MWCLIQLPGFAAGAGGFFLIALSEIAAFRCKGN